IAAMGSGALNINGGTLAANNTRTIAARFTSVTVGGDFTFGAVTTGVSSGNGSNTANISIADNVALGTTTRTITIGAAGTYTLSGIISGTAGLTVNGAGGGILALSGANTFTGATSVNGGTLSFTTALSRLGAGTAINFGGGTLQWGTSNVVDISTRTVTINSGGATIDTGANAVTLVNAIGNNGTGMLTKIGTGTLTLLGA